MRSKRIVLILAGLFLLPGFVRAGWVRQNSVTKRNLWCVSFIDTSLGWAAGEALVRTTDGGRHWTVLIDSLPSQQFFVDLSFVDSLHGWGAVPLEGVYATTDGGENWSLQLSNGSCQAIKFVSPNRGYAGGWYTDGQGDVFNWVSTTTNGGFTWQNSVERYPSTWCTNDVEAIGPTFAWAVGEGDSFCTTTDSGSTWVIRPSSGQNLAQASFGGLNAGWGLNWNLIQATTDAGLSWHQQFSDTVVLFGISARDSLHAWVSGRGGCILATSDGGMTWQRQLTGCMNYLRSVAFVDTLHGWAVCGGPDSLILHTEDGGASFVEEETEGVRGQGLGIRVTAKPNPFSSFATILGHEAERFALYDIAGRRVGTYKGERIGMDLRPGVYFIRALEGRAGLGRIVKIR